MLRFRRRVFLVLLAMSLPSQLIAVEASTCNKMGAREASSCDHVRCHDVGALVSSRDDGATSHSAPADCMTTAACINAVALPVTERSDSTAEFHQVVAVVTTAAPSTLATAPDSPPPRR